MALAALASSADFSPAAEVASVIFSPADFFRFGKSLLRWAENPPP